MKNGRGFESQVRMLTSHTGVSSLNNQLWRLIQFTAHTDLGKQQREMPRDIQARSIHVGNMTAFQPRGQLWPLQYCRELRIEMAGVNVLSLILSLSISPRLELFVGLFLK